MVELFASGVGGPWFKSQVRSTILLLQLRFQNLLGDGNLLVGFFQDILTDRVGLVVELFASGVGGPWFKSQVRSAILLLQLRFQNLLGDGNLLVGFFQDILTDRVGLVVELFASGVGGPWFKSQVRSTILLLQLRFQNLLRDGHLLVGFFQDILTDRVGLVVELFASGVGGPWFKSQVRSTILLLQLRFQNSLRDGNLLVGFFQDILTDRVGLVVELFASGVGGPWFKSQVRSTILLLQLRFQNLLGDGNLLVGFFQDILTDRVGLVVELFASGVGGPWFKSQVRSTILLLQLRFQNLLRDGNLLVGFFQDILTDRVGLVVELFASGVGGPWFKSQVRSTILLLQLRFQNLLGDGNLLVGFFQDILTDRVGLVVELFASGVGGPWFKSQVRSTILLLQLRFQNSLRGRKFISRIFPRYFN